MSFTDHLFGDITLLAFVLTGSPSQKIIYDNSNSETYHSIHFSLKETQQFIDSILLRPVTELLSDPVRMSTEMSSSTLSHSQNKTSPTIDYQSSPLLSLPSELRHEVYAWIFPWSEIIHVQCGWWSDDTETYKPPAGIWFLNCNPDVEEYEAKDKQLNDCQRCSLPHPNNRVPPGQPDQEAFDNILKHSVDLNILKTCRQIRYEASVVFLHNNILNFVELSNLLQFITIPGWEFGALRCMSICINSPHREIHVSKHAKSISHAFQRLLDIKTTFVGLTYLYILTNTNAYFHSRYHSIALSEDDVMIVLTLCCLNPFAAGLRRAVVHIVDRSSQNRLAREREELEDDLTDVLRRGMSALQKTYDRGSVMTRVKEQIDTYRAFLELGL